jgi:Co/Zn/Cd efflux system component
LKVSNQGIVTYFLEKIMSANCSHQVHAMLKQDTSPRYRRILWIALIVNALMFFIEIGAGLTSGSVSLLADSVDFFGDAANYGLALWALSLAAVWGSRVALLKGITMLLFGLTVLARTAWSAWAGQMPEAITMGAIGLLALAANLLVAALLYQYREGNANMRSVWLCTRNDAFGNIAVLLAGIAVWSSGSAWPDLAVALVMAGLAIHSGIQVVSHARAELAAAMPRQATQ